MEEYKSIMNLFLKYPSLTNHYAINKSRLLQSYLVGDKQEALFYATEKIDGANIQLSFSPYERNFAFYKRSGKIEEDEKPFDAIKDIISDDEIAEIMENFIYQYEELSEYRDTVVHVYGELFGSKIQKQSYNLTKEKKRSIRFYDIIVDSPEDSNQMIELGIVGIKSIVPEKFLPFFIEGGCKKPLSKWLVDEPSSESVYGGINEGYVFKLVEPHLFEREGTYIGIKYKTDAYLEVAKVPKAPRKQHEVKNPELVYDVSRYVTEQRLMNILSHGEVALSFENFGTLMSLMTDDILKEYLRDEDHAKYEDDEVEEAVNKGNNKLIAEVIRNVIKRG